MKTIQMQNWEIEALVNHLKSCVRIPLSPQPQKDKDMWHWMDYQWQENRLGFPKDELENHSSYHPGDIVNVQDTDIYIRILKIHTEQLWEITNVSAEKEGCQGVFSGTGEAFGSGWEITPSQEYAKRWDRKSNEAFLVWNFNPWVEVIEFETVSKEEAGVAVAAACKYCFGKTRVSFRCDVRTLRDDGITEDIPVPSIFCPYCGKILKTAVS